MLNRFNYNDELSQVNSKLTWGGGYLLALSSKTTFFHSVKLME